MMKWKASPWLFLAAALFTINALYWAISHTDDLVGISIFSIAAILLYLAGVGNWRMGN